MYNSSATSFCTVYLVWCTVSYSFYLFACIFLCGAIDGMLFMKQLGQGFEDADTTIKSIIAGSSRGFVVEVFKPPLFM
jgi:hypothetical protein